MIGLFYFIPERMNFNLDFLNFGNMLRKIPAALKRTDAKVARAQQQGEGKPLAHSGSQEFIDAPYTRQATISGPMTHYEGARFCWQAYGSDGRFQAAINKLAFKATQPNNNRRPFEIEVQVESASEKQEIWATLHDVFGALSLYRRLRSMAIAALVEGESYYRMTVDAGSNRIVGLKKIKGARSGFEIFGPIDNPAFPQYHGMYLQVNKAAANQPVNLFYNWEVLPLYWNFDEEIERGTPLGISTKAAYLNTTDDERYLTIARRWRSGKRLVHSVGDVALSSDQFIANVNVIKEMQARAGKDEPFSDLYVTKDGDVKTLDETSASLWNISDLKHHEGVYFDGLQTPRALYSAGSKDVPNRSVMDVIYDEWIASYVAAAEDMLTGDADPSGIHGDGLLKLVELQLNLLGKTSRITPVNFIWPSKARLTAEEVKALELAYKSGHLSETTYFSKLLKIDFETEMEMKLREQKFLLKHEKEMEKLRQERERLRSKSTFSPVNKPEADEEDELHEQVDLTSLLGRRNGYYLTES